MRKIIEGLDEDQLLQSFRHNSGNNVQKRGAVSDKKTPKIFFGVEF
jgi:hypothetical protein